MTQLQRFDHDGLELIIDTQTGESFATINGYSRMSGKAISTISERVSKVVAYSENLIKSAEIVTPGGVQGVRLIPEIIISEWIIKDNPELAFKMLQAGVRLYLHGLAGYKYQVVEQAQLPSWERANKAAIAVEDIHKRVVDISPRLAQLLIDAAVNDVLGKQLPEKPLKGVCEIAEAMGYKVNHKNRGNLGKFVKAQCLDLMQLEKRLVNGQMREIACYPDNQEVRCIINKFFS